MPSALHNTINMTGHRFLSLKPDLQCQNCDVLSASLTFSFHPGTILHCGLARGIVFALEDKQMDMIVLHISLI